VIDFEAAWCAPTTSRAFKQAEPQYPSIGFFKVKIDDHDDITPEVGVPMVPKIIAFKNGKAVRDCVNGSPSAIHALLTAVQDV